jgi:hypothetical protein
LASQRWSAGPQSGPKARGWFNTAAGADGRSALVFGGFDGDLRRNDVHLLQF